MKHVIHSILREAKNVNKPEFSLNHSNHFDPVRFRDFYNGYDY
jgi:hypothetical protein